MTNKLLQFLVLLIVFASPAMAQQGTISGVIVDKDNGETLIGANVRIEGTALGSTTDLDGQYVIKGLVAGSYNLIASYIGYNPITVQNVDVLAGETTTIDLQMSSEAIGLDEVIVEARALENTEGALLRERQKSVSVSDAISAEAISRSGSGDAASAMTRVTGASVVAGKYVYIRGLGDRYSSTQLNGSTLPSADPDKQSFQLDLFPSNLLDNIVTTKTFTPDKPGNFTGGLVNVGTKNYPEAFTFQVSTSSSYNTQTSLANGFLSYQGGGSDWLGFDDGTRSIPDVFLNEDLQIPSEIEARFDPEKAVILDEVSRAFRPEMTPTSITAPVNSSASIAIGDQLTLFGRPLGYTGSISFSNSASFYDDGEAGRWELVGGQVDDIDNLTSLRSLSDTRGSEEANWGGLATLAYKLHANHEISGTYLRTQSGTTDSRFLDGSWQDLSGNSTFETRVLGYQERALNSLQFKGEHVVEGITAEWKASFSRNEQDEPDLRYFSSHLTVLERAGGVVDTVYQKPASLYPAPTRFFRNLQEDNNSAGLDISVPFKGVKGLTSKFKFGGAYTRVERNFNERRFEYREAPGLSYNSFGGDANAFFAATGIIDTAANGRPVFGNYIIDASSEKNNYSGDQTVSAAYGMVDLLLTRKLRLIGGVRLEATRMTTASEDAQLAVGRLSNDDFLPSVNVVYELGENMNLRAAYTQTLARPTFRELAPYSTFDFVGDFVFSGNSTLKRTLVSNYDLRWEWFTRPGEILAASVFYKAFQNPLERVILTQAGNNALSIQNVESGMVAGLELEIRKRLDSITSVLKDVQVGANLSLVHSEVDIPEAELSIIRAADPNAGTTRSLVGQSPMLANLNVTYDRSEQWGSVLSLYMNVFGDRLRVVSEGAAPDIFERARTTVDLVYSQRIWRGISMKFSAKNLTDSEALLSQQFKNTDYTYQVYESGRTFSLGFTYKVE
ncbi:MAG: TonB-dependent receptor [Rhodothermales bacterium]